MHMTWELYCTIATALVGLPTTIVVFLRSCFALDKVVPGPFVDAAQNILHSNVDTKSALTFFLERFDMLFCSPDTPWPSFWRCARFSFLTFIGIMCSWVILSSVFSVSAINDFIYFFFFSGEGWPIPMTSFQNAFATAILVISLNIVGDYISLWETRFILGKISQSRSPIVVVAIWTADIIATAAIIAFFLLLWPLILLFISLLYGGLQIDAILWDRVLMFPIEVLTTKEIFLFSEPESLVLSICIYTSLSTTLWAGLSIFAMNSWKLVRLANFFPRANKRPFGALTATVILFLLVLVTFIQILFRYVM